MNDDPNQFPESYIKNLQVQYNSKIEDAVVVKQNLYGRNLKDSETIYVGGSLNVSDTLTSNYFQDSDNSQYRIDPFPENILTPTRLKNLSLRGNLVVTDISSAKNFVSTADFFTESNLTLTEGDFTSANTIRTSIFEDYQDSNYKVEMSGKAELLSLKLNQTMTGVNIDSNNASKIVSVVGNSQSQALTVFGNNKSLYAFKIIDGNDKQFSVDPSSNSSLQSVISTDLTVELVKVRESLELLDPTTVFGDIEIGKSFSSKSSYELSGRLEIQSGATTMFLLTEKGEITKAKSLELSEGLTLTSQNSQTTINGGMDQTSTQGENILSNTTAYADVTLWGSSIDISGKAFLLSTEGRVDSIGQASFSTAIFAGYTSLNSKLDVSGDYIYLESDNNSLALMHDTAVLRTPLNIQVKTASIADQIISSSILITPLVSHPDGIFMLNPNGITRFNIVSVYSDAGVGGGVILSSPLHFSSINDIDQTALSIDPSKFTTISQLSMRTASFSSGAIIKSVDDDTVLKIRSDDTNHKLISLSDNSFTLSNDATIQSSGNLNFSGQFHIKSQSGLVMTTTLAGETLPSINVTSSVFSLLIGKAGQNADSLHRHSEVRNIPLTDIIRRDLIFNEISSRQTFTKSGLGIFLQPKVSSTNPLFVQKNDSGSDTILIYGNGQIDANIFHGDGRNLREVEGNDIKDLSLTKEDFGTDSINNKDKVQIGAITSNKIDRKVVTGDHFKDDSSGEITSSKIKNKTFTGIYLKNDEILTEDFKANSVQSKHLARASVDSNKIAADTLGVEKFESKSINNDNLVTDTLETSHFSADQIRLYHLSNNSIDSTRVITNSIQEIDLATDSVGFEEIETEAISSRIIATGAIVMSKINTSAISSNKIVSGSLIHEDFVSGSITLSKVKTASITSREIKNLSLKNADFKDLSITTDILDLDSILTRHLQASEIQASHIKDNNILVEHIQDRAIKTNEILNYTILNDDFLTNTIDPSDIIDKTIAHSQISDNAVTNGKINSSGISSSRFQPLAFETDNIKNAEIKASHLASASILSRHLEDDTIIAADIANNDIDAIKIKDYGIQTNNINDYSLTTDTVKNSNVLRKHFVDDSIESVDIAVDSITTDRLKDNAIQSKHIVNNTFKTSDFGDNSAVLGKFAQNSIDVDKIDQLELADFVDNSITEIKLSSDTFQTSRFDSQIVTSGKILDRQIVNSHIKTLSVTENTIKTSMLSSARFGEDLFSTAKIQPETITTIKFDTGSIRSDNIATNQINSAVIKNRSLLEADVANNAVSQRALANTTVTSDSIKLFTLTSRTLKADSITNQKLKIKGISTDSIINDNQILGDLILSNSLKADVIASDSILFDHIADSAITNSKLKINILTSGHIKDKNLESKHFTSNMIQTRHLTDSAIISSKIAAQTVSNENFAADTIQNDRFADSIFLNRHFKTRQFNGDEISGTLPVSLFRSASISGPKLLDDSIEESKILSWSILGVHFADNAVTRAKIKTDAITDVHLQDAAITTAKIKDAQIINRHLQNYIIESVHIKDGSLDTSDVMTRSLPGSKFESGSIHNNNVKNGAVRSEHIYDFSINGDLFQSNIIEASKIGNDSINYKDVKVKTLQESRLADDAVKSSDVDSLFHLRRSEIASDTITSSHFGNKTIKPYHFSDGSITASKLGEVSGKIFSNNTISRPKIADSALDGSRIVSNTFYEDDLNIIYSSKQAGSNAQIQRTKQSDTSTNTWQESPAQADNTQLQKEPSTNATKFSFTDGAKLKTRNLSDGSNETTVKDFASLTIDTIYDHYWYESDKFYVITGKNNANYTYSKYNSTTGLDIGWTLSTLLTGSTDLIDIERKDSSNFLGLGSNGKIYYSTTDTFNPNYLVVDNNYEYKNPFFGPDEDYIYAVKIIEPSSHYLVKIPWGGGTDFGEEISIHDRFSTQDVSFESVKLDEDGDEILMLAKIPSTDSLDIYKISTEGTGLTTYNLSNLNGDFLAIDAEKYNPYIADDTVESDIIKDRTIPTSRIASRTVTRGNLKGGGIDEGSFEEDGLVNNNFADDSMTYVKWETRSIANEKLATDIFETNKIKDRSLINRVIKDSSLTGRTFENNTFDSSHIKSQNLVKGVIQQESFDNNKIGSDISADDFADGSVEGAHLTGLTSAAIADSSISAKKFKNDSIQLKHVGKSTLVAEDLASESFSASKFLTNQFEGNLLEDNSITYNKLINLTINGDNLAEDSVLAENIADLSIQKRHFKSGAFQSSNVDTDAVTTRTLGASAITSTELAENSIARVQIKNDAVINGAIVSDTIEAAKISNNIFNSDHFTDGSINNSDRIALGSIKTENLPFSEISEAKIDSGVSLSSSKIVPGALQNNVTGLTKAKVKDSEISDIHISPNSITTAKIQNNAVSSAKLRDQALKTRHFSDNSVNNDSIVDAEITNDDIAEGTLLNAKFSTNTITNNRFADNSIDAVKLSSNSFSNASIADAEISTAKFKNNGILEEDIADGAITSNKINDAIITSAVMVSEALTSRVLAQNSLINDDFGNNEIYSEHFQNSTIESEKIALDTIDTDNLDNLAVSGSKLFKVDDDTTLLIRSDSANNSTNMTDRKNQRTVTRQGNTKHSTTQKKFGATSIYFDGDGDYLELDDSDDLAFRLWEFHH